MLHKLQIVQQIRIAIENLHELSTLPDWTVSSSQQSTSFLPSNRRGELTASIASTIADWPFASSSNLKRHCIFLIAHLRRLADRFVPLPVVLLALLATIHPVLAACAFHQWTHSSILVLAAGTTDMVRILGLRVGRRARTSEYQIPVEVFFGRIAAVRRFNQALATEVICHAVDVAIGTIQSLRHLHVLVGHA